MRKINILITLFLMLMSSAVDVRAQFSGSGSGTESDPYKIFNPVQLDQVRNFVGQSGVYFTLMSDIDLGDYIADNNPNQGWQPIGSESQPFQGVFTGNGHKVSGLYINRTADYTGFWGSLSNATVTGLTLSFSDNCKGGNYTGVFSGNIENSVITDCPVSGTSVIGIDYTGGYVGRIGSSTISNSDAILTSSVSGSNNVGGYAGIIDSGIIDASNIKCDGVNGNMYIGGFIGYYAGNTITSQKMNSQILYETIDGKIIEPQNSNEFDAKIISNTYVDGQGKLLFDNSISKVPQSCFQNLSTLTKIELPTSISQICQGSFANCENLHTVQLPDSLQIIEKSAFSGCKSLNAVTIPININTIGDSTFFGCTNLTDITVLPITPPVIGQQIFPQSDEAHIYVPWPNPKVYYKDKNWGAYSLNDNILFYTSTDKQVITPYDSKDFDASIVSNTYLDGIGKITFDGKIKNFGSRSFYKCTTLDSLFLPTSITKIGAYAFAGCTNLTSINIPSSVMVIGSMSPFGGCTSLPVIDGLRYADTYLVGPLDKTLSNYSIREGTKWIGDDAFESCAKLTNISIPKSVTNIQSQAFARSGLTSIIIPESVVAVGPSIFSDCNDLQSIYCKAKVYLNVTYILAYTKYTTILYVPKELYQTYKTAAGTKYENQIK